MGTEHIRVTKGARMRHICTTATAVEKFKHEAKRLRDETGTPLTAALELVAKKAGYDHWKHVNSCAAVTAAERRTSSSLPMAAADSHPSDSMARQPSSGVEPQETKRRHLEQLIRELFSADQLRALLVSDVVSFHNSSSGGAFAEMTDGRRPRADTTEGLTGHVLPKLVEVLRGLDQSGPLLDADVRIEGVDLCLAVVLPPVSSPPSWSITRRAHVDVHARRPVLLDVI